MDRKFSYHRYPENTADFEDLMLAVDHELSIRGLKPFQRPFNAGRLFWEAFGWGGLATPPKELANREGFQGDILMAKAYLWYEQFYGEQLKSDFSYGYMPVRIRNAIWRVRAGVTYGQVRLFLDRDLTSRGTSISHKGEASFNILCAIENFPQGLADRLTDVELTELLELYLLMQTNLQWRQSIPKLELFEMARNDYDASTSDVLGHRYGQARWGAQQAIEKTLKGVLTVAKTRFPTGGPNGHNLIHLAELLEKEHEIKLMPQFLTLAACPPKVRYGEEVSTQEQAINANHSVIAVLEQLRTNKKVKKLFQEFEADMYR